MMHVFEIYGILTAFVWTFVYVVCSFEEREFFPFSSFGEFVGIMIASMFWPLLIFSGFIELGKFCYNMYKKRTKRIADLRVMIEQKYEWYD